MKKIKNTTILLLIMTTLSPLVISSCKEEVRQTVYIDQKTKDYVVFQTGSWWSYEEKSSGEIDSITISAYESKIEYWEGYSDKNFELTSMYLKWASDLDFDPIAKNRFLRVWSNTEGENQVHVEEQYPWFLFPNIVYIPFDEVGDNRWIWQNDTIRYEAHYDSLSVRGKIYYDVMELSSSLHVHDKKQKRIFWAKNIGRIKWENFGGEIWEIADYNAIQ